MLANMFGVVGKRLIGLGVMMLGLRSAMGVSTLTSAPALESRVRFAVHVNVLHIIAPEFFFIASAEETQESFAVHQDALLESCSTYTPLSPLRYCRWIKFCRNVQ